MCLNAQSHSFTRSSFNINISYCSNCGIFQYQNLISVKPSNFISKIEYDHFIPLPHSLEPQKKNVTYMTIRPVGIKIIKYLSTKNELDENIFHSSIYLLDYLFIQKKYVNDIKQAAIACVIIMTKFKGDGVKAKKLEREMISNIKEFSYNVIEQNILKVVDYKLNFVTVFDIMNDILHKGILFIDENTRMIDKIYLSCLVQLNAIVENKIILNYKETDIVFSIIAFTRELYGLKNRSYVLDEIYGMTYDRKCFNEIKKRTHVKRCKSIGN